MNRFFYVLIATIGLVFLAPPPLHAGSLVYPNGISAPSRIVTGIYPGDDAGNCCWVGKSGEFYADVPPGADTLLLNIYLPEFSVRGGRQSLRVQIGANPPFERCCLGPGEHEVTVPLPLSARSGQVTIRVSPGRTFVPKELGINQDTRHLGVMLRDVGFLNSVTGERLDNAVVPWMPARATVPLLLAGGILVFVLTLRRPLFGFLAIVATDPFLFSYAIHGTTLTLPKVTLLAVAFGLIPHYRSIANIHTRRAFWILAGAQAFFVLTMLPGTAHALFHSAALRETLKAIEYLATIVVAYCAYRIDPSEKALRTAFSLLTIVVTAAAFVQGALHVGESEVIAGHYLPRIAGPLDGPNQFAGFLEVLVPVMLAFALFRRRFIPEWVAIAMGTIASVMTLSRGGLAALAIAVFMVLAIRFAPAYRGVVASCLGLLFVLVLGLAFGVFSGSLGGRIQSLFGMSGEGAFNGGLGSRVDLWHGAFALWRSRPIFGIGPGNFELEVGRFFPGARTHANGMYFQVLAEQGLLGLIALFALTAATVGVFVRRIDQPLVLGACAVALAMAFHQIVDCIWLYPKIGVIWWAVLAAGATVVDLTSEARLRETDSPPLR